MKSAQHIGIPFAITGVFIARLSLTRYYLPNGKPYNFEEATWKNGTQL
jgi:hypothetical protein